MVDTWAATAAGAFSLTENNLYTVEAFRDYVAHLEPDGILSLTRWHLEPPDQLLRLFSLARAMMDELGSCDPARHLLLVRGVPEPGSAARRRDLPAEEERVHSRRGAPRGGAGRGRAASRCSIRR